VLLLLLCGAEGTVCHNHAGLLTETDSGMEAILEEISRAFQEQKKAMREW